MAKIKAKVIAIHNHKGGVLKTTLSTNLAGALSLNGKKVLIVELDGQGNVLSSFGRNSNELEYTIYDMFFGKAELKDVIVNIRKGLDVLPSSNEMSNFDFIIGKGGTNKSLNEIITEAEVSYDYIFIDTSANLGVSTLGALYRASTIIVPFVIDKFGLDGLVALKNEITNKIITQNDILEKILFVPTKYVSNSRNQNDVLAQLEAFFKDDKLFKLSKIRIKRSVVFQNSILEKNLPLVFTRKRTTKALLPIFEIAEGL